jgi:hypothetical protein
MPPRPSDSVTLFVSRFSIDWWGEDYLRGFVRVNALTPGRDSGIGASCRCESDIFHVRSSPYPVIDTDSSLVCRRHIVGFARRRFLQDV